MPPAIAAIAAAAANFALDAALVLGGTSASLAVAEAAFLITYAVVEVGIYAGLSLAVNAAFAPKIPGQKVQIPLKQAIPPRRVGYGRARLSGYYMLYESRDVAAFGSIAGGGGSFDILALHDGKVAEIEQYYLDDDVVVTDGAGRVQRVGDKYASRIYLDHRLGEPTETVYAKTNHWMSDLWPSTSRGDGVASLEMIAFQSKPANQLKDYPNGLPHPSISGKLLEVYDPRTDSTAWSENPILQLMDYLTSVSHGMGLDYATYILPEIAAWIQAADDCEDLVPISGVDTEQAYRSGGVYDVTTAPSEVIATLLATCDGWLAQRGTGALTVRAGKYAAPTVTITDKYVLGYTVRHFLPDDEVVNELRPTFTSADNKFIENDAGAWQNADDIFVRGQVKSQSMPLPWCPSATQALRLAKRQMFRQSTELRGTVKINLYGLSALGERYLTLNITDNAALTNLVVEVAKIAVDLATLSVTIDWVAADPAVDDWTTDDQDNATGQQPAPPPTSPVPELDAPTITSVTPTYQLSSSSDTGARLDIVVGSGINASVEWLVRWRVQGTTNWNEGAYTDIDDGASVELITGFVTASATLEVEVAYKTAGRTSPWSATATVVVAAPTTAFEDAVGAIAGASDTLPASEALAAKDMVNVWNDAGTAKARKADASDPDREAHGWVAAAVLSGADALVKFGGLMTGLSGLTAGPVFLSTSAGLATSTPPSGSGEIVQQVGEATSATEIAFAPEASVELR